MLQLVYSLTGNPTHAPVLDGQLDSFLAKLRLDVEDIIWEGTLRHAPGAVELYETFQDLAPSDRAQIFLSPEGFSALNAVQTNRSTASLQELASAFRTVLQDRQADYGIIDAESVVCGRASGRMRLGGTIKVDLESAACQKRDPTSPVFFGVFDPFTNHEMQIIARKLFNAFAEIERSAPTFARLIRNYTRKIYIRKNGVLSPSSEQVDTEIGAIRLRNVHLERYSHDHLVDDLIHESVHNFISTHEYVGFPFMTYGGRNDLAIRPVSPWSLRPIRILPLIHAAFVYFALLHYADGQLQRTLSDIQLRRFQQRRNSYASGFLLPGFISDHVREFADVDPRALYALDTMQDIVRDKHGVSPAPSSNVSGQTRVLEVVS